MHLNDLQFFHTMTICFGLGISNVNIASSFKEHPEQILLLYCFLLML